MKKLVVGLSIGVAGFALAWAIVSQQATEKLLRERALWENEKASLQAALNEANARKPQRAPSVIETEKVVRVREEISPREIIERLQQIRVASGPAQIKNARLAIQQFENLIAAGPSALPAIREFLLRNEEIDYESSFSPRASRDGKISTEFALPPSLRFGLFDAARQIGGSEAEKLLADILATTGRGAEIAYLARVLEDIAPGKYRELSITAVRELLARRSAPGASGLDKYDREYLYGVLGLYGDPSFAGEAQSQLVRSDGVVDRGALKYLQQTVGPQALPSIMQAYDDPTLDPSKKEPLVRYALTYAGVDPQATAFWHKAVTDPKFPLDDRRELIEDLNQDGIQNEDKPTARDARVIAERLKLIDKLGESDNPAIKEAWEEAATDLRNMGLNFLSQPKGARYVLGQDNSKGLSDQLIQASSAP